MPSQASIPGKAHKPGWTAQKPYETPDDRMPRRFTAQTDDVPQDQRPRAIPFDYAQPETIAGERPVNTNPDARPMVDDFPVGKHPKNPGAPATRPTSGVKRAR